MKRFNLIVIIILTISINMLAQKNCNECRDFLIEQTERLMQKNKNNKSLIRDLKKLKSNETIVILCGFGISGVFDSMKECQYYVDANKPNTPNTNINNKFYAKCISCKGNNNSTTAGNEKNDFTEKIQSYKDNTPYIDNKLTASTFFTPGNATVIISQSMTNAQNGNDIENYFHVPKPQGRKKGQMSGFDSRTKEEKQTYSLFYEDEMNKFDEKENYPTNSIVTGNDFGFGSPEENFEHNYNVITNLVKTSLKESERKKLLATIAFYKEKRKNWQIEKERFKPDLIHSKDSMEFTKIKESIIWQYENSKETIKKLIDAQKALLEDETITPEEKKQIQDELKKLKEEEKDEEKEKENIINMEPSSPLNIE